MIQTAYHQN